CPRSCGRCWTPSKQTALSPPTKENRPGGLRRAGTAGSACRSTCGRERGDSGDRRALRLGQPALPAAPACRRPPRRLSVGRSKAWCLTPPDIRDHRRRLVEPPQAAGVEDRFDRAQEVVVIVGCEGDASGTHAGADERAVHAVRTADPSLVEDDDEEESGAEIRIGQERLE